MVAAHRHKSGWPALEGGASHACGRSRAHEAWQCCARLPRRCLAPACQVREVLSHIEASALLPPLVVLQTLAANPHLTLSVVKGYMARTLSAEGALLTLTTPNPRTF